MKQADLELLLERQQAGELSDSEQEVLTRMLREHRWARALFVARLQLGASLKERFENEQQAMAAVDSPVSFRPSPGPSKRGVPLALMAAAVVVVVMGVSAFLLPFVSSPKPIATLVSSEGAAWESPLPTTPGSELPPGYLVLKTGVATIEFRSGVEVVLEAPAHLELETPMRGRLLAGAAVIRVPEQAIGFIMGSPDGYAVDHGTEFAVSVDLVARQSTFEVLSGEISVHHPGSDEELRLVDRQLAVVKAGGVSADHSGGENGSLPLVKAAVRLQAQGREQTLIRSNEREDKVHEDFLMAKRSSFVAAFDRRSLFSFDLSARPESAEEIRSARLSLNLVPCGLGFASRLPSTSTFSIYAIAGAIPDVDLQWDAAPQPGDGKLVGSFSVSRGQSSGSFSVETPELVEFLQASEGSVVTFLLVRDTDEAEGNGLVHAFAASSHPEASGPALEIR